MHSSRSGDIAEQTAILWLAKQGYEVFPNFGCTGPIDLIALDLETGETKLIDVKKSQKYVRPDGSIKLYSNPTGTFRARAIQEDLGVFYLFADIDTGECYWGNDP